MPLSSAVPCATKCSLGEGTLEGTPEWTPEWTSEWTPEWTTPDYDVDQSLQILERSLQRKIDTINSATSVSVLVDKLMEIVQLRATLQNMDTKHKVN